MKYFYRIIFMPVVLLALIALNLTTCVVLLFTGRMINSADDIALLELIDRTVMPLIRLME